eukprot:1735678-Rhodomonas_salina.1
MDAARSDLRGRRHPFRMPESQSQREGGAYRVRKRQQVFPPPHLQPRPRTRREPHQTSSCQTSLAMAVLV